MNNRTPLDIATELVSEITRMQQQVVQLRDEADRYKAALEAIYELKASDTEPPNKFPQIWKLCKEALPPGNYDDDATEEMPVAPEAPEERDDSNVVKIWKLERIKETRTGRDLTNFWWVAFTDPVVKLTLFEADVWTLRECGFEIDQYAKIQEVDIEIQWFFDNRRYKAIRAVKKDGEWIDFQKKRMGFDRVVRARAAQARYNRSHRY